MPDISRRKFIQLSVIGGAAAAAGGCRDYGIFTNERVYKAEVTGQYGGYDNRVEPYVNQPDGLQDGIPQYFATVCQMCPAGCGIYVRTMNGRALKVEGNPAHPVSGGKTCARGQAAVQHLYNPDRLRTPLLRARRNGNLEPQTWETALQRIADGLKPGAGRVAILTDPLTIDRSPTARRVVAEFAQSIGGVQASWSIMDGSPWRAAMRSIYGRSEMPTHRIDEADVLLGFSSNFLEAWPSPVYYNRLFGEFRQGARRGQGEHGRFVYIGPRMSATAAKADRWIPCAPGSEGAAALGILTALGGAGIPIDEAARLTGIDAARFGKIAALFASGGARSLAVGGDTLLSGSNGSASVVAVESLNTHVRSPLVQFGGVTDETPGLYRPLEALIEEMYGGGIRALLVLGQPNPAFTLPAAAGWAAAAARVPFIAALTPFLDETTAQADVVVPTRTFLEEWGDDQPLVAPAGFKTTSIRQPIIDPVFVGGYGEVHEPGPHRPWMDTRPLGDVLPDLAQRLGHPLTDSDGLSATRRTWSQMGQADLATTSLNNDAAWVSAVSLGGYWPAQPATTNISSAAGLPAAAAGASAAAPSDDMFALHLYPHIYFSDGRHANLPWMQEIPDPMTAAVWNSWIEINMDVAHRMGIFTGDIVRLTTAHGYVTGPAIPYPGLHPGAVAMPIGQGHAPRAYGGNAGQGSNPLAILDPTIDPDSGALAYGATRVRLERVRGAVPMDLVLLQDRPNGAEPEAVQDLIHTTAREWRKAHPKGGKPQDVESIFRRQPGGGNEGK